MIFSGRELVFLGRTSDVPGILIKSCVELPSQSVIRMVQEGVKDAWSYMYGIPRLRQTTSLSSPIP